MKQEIVIVLGAIVLDAFAACSRERGEELFNKFHSCAEGTVVTNKGECVRTVKDDTGVYECWYTADAGVLRRIRIQRSDGGVDIYDYRGGILDSAGSSTPDRKSAVTTVFVGDGRSTNSVDKIEFDVIDGKPIGPIRLFDACGRHIERTLPVRLGSIDKEYLPSPGMTGKIGPYDWTIVREENREAVLSRNGKKLVESKFSLGGKYPWIVGRAYARPESAKRNELWRHGIQVEDQYRGICYYFVVDMRNDQIEYIPLDKEDDIERITGYNLSSYEIRNFWSYFLSKRGPERLAKLEEALKPPAK